MKKTLFTILFFSIFILTFSQNYVETKFPLKHNKIIFEETIKTKQKINADNLYINYHKWLIDNFNDNKSVVQFDDRATKTIIIKYYFSVLRYDYKNLKIWFTQSMKISKNKYHYNIYDITYEYDKNKKHYSGPYEDFLIKPNIIWSKEKYEQLSYSIIRNNNHIYNRFQNIILSIKDVMENNSD